MHATPAGVAFFFVPPVPGILAPAAIEAEIAGFRPAITAYTTMDDILVAFSVAAAFAGLPSFALSTDRAEVHTMMQQPQEQ
jgi:hypothetical protein